MSDRSKLVSQAHFETVMKEYLREVLYARMETTALEKALVAAGVVTEDRLRLAREQVRQEMKAELDALGQGAPGGVASTYGSMKDPVQ